MYTITKDPQFFAFKKYLIKIYAVGQDAYIVINLNKDPQSKNLNFSKFTNTLAYLKFANYSPVVCLCGLPHNRTACGDISFDALLQIILELNSDVT